MINVKYTCILNIWCISTFILFFNLENIIDKFNFKITSKAKNPFLLYAFSCMV